MTGARVAPLRLVAALAVVTACSASASTSTQTGHVPSGSGASGPVGTGKPAHTGGADSGSGAGDSSGGGPGPASGPGVVPVASGTLAPACVPALNDLYTSLFSGRVLMRLPKGVELVEQNGFYATMAASQQSTSCGAPVKFAAVGFFQQPAGDLLKVRDALLELRGIPAETVTWSEEGSRGRNYTGAYTTTQDPRAQAPATRGWLVLREAPNDKYAYFALLETDESSWAGLRSLFQDAGRNLLVKPRALQAPEVIAPKPVEPEPKKPKKGKGKPKAAAAASK
ncbi:hypothetical protein [Nannocystis sp.]|uniref:hypothetical protein n=1 Tax=Nannocystis sp. TaxID=1962667 RepID=UPI0025DADEB1|nr:hypothetical protein [Nannocystis sp.]MBK7824050.1 hypothetical protein [Nannocystis sp.]